MISTPVVNQWDPSCVVTVIPAYNEERFIASVVLTAKEYSAHVVVVDDGSDDRTANLAMLAGAKVVQMPKNVGKARALNAGFVEARKYAAKAVVVLDGDAQHDPADIPFVVGPILEGQDVVVGSRFLDVKSHIPWWRKIGQHSLTAMTNVTSGFRLTDSQSGFRAFSLRAVDVLAFQSDGLNVESEMQFLLSQSDLSVVEVPIKVSYRDGNKRNPFTHGLQIIDMILGVVARRRPLLFFTFPGTVFACLGILFGTWVVQIMDASHQLPVGTAIMSTIFVLGGGLLAVTGIILHSLEHFSQRLQKDIMATLGSREHNA